MTVNNLKVVKLAMTLWLIGWFVRAPYFCKYLFIQTSRYPIEFDFFPRFLQSSDLSISLFFLPVLVIPALIKPAPYRLVLAAIILTVCAFLSLIHLDTYNDATYVTCFWTGIWLIFVSWNISREDQQFQYQAMLLAQLIVGVTFMGGAVGKMTSEYVNGEAWIGLFMSQDHYWLANMLRLFIPEEQVMGVSKYLSRLMILGEFIIGLLPLIPYRIGAIGASILMICMMPLTNTVLIFSVLACLIGILIGPLYWKTDCNLKL